MNAAHQYRRSRSPSPVPSRTVPDPNERSSSMTEDPRSKDNNSNTLTVDPATSRRLRAHSWRAIKLNQHLVNNNPVHLLVDTQPSSSQNYNFMSHHREEDLLIPQQRTRRYSDGEMNGVEDSIGFVRDYGSVNSSSFVPSSTHDDDDDSSNGESVAASMQSQQSKNARTYFTPSMVDNLRKRNKLYFLDPITKLRYYHGYPWKLTLQIVKLILITSQIVIFGAQRESIIEYFERSQLAFKHLLLNKWDPSYETMPYPPATGQYAVYTLPELHEHMNFVLKQYYHLPEESLAAISIVDTNQTTPNPIELCFKANSYFNFDDQQYLVSAKLLENCTLIYPLGSPGNYTYDVNTYINEIGFYLPFNRTLEMTLKFYVRTFHLNLLQTHYGPACYNETVVISYLNIERSGQLLVTLVSNPSEIDCDERIISSVGRGELNTYKMRNIGFDSSVMVICILSTILCSRSLHRSNKLRIDTAKYFRCHRGKPFTFSNHLEFINYWYIIIICNDILTTVGSAFKIQLEMRVFSISSQNYELCSIFLGLGTFLSYVGILRYLGFFKSYNVLILTLKTSFPHVMRFLVCAICLYTGFLFCGWVIFSPYHIKFRKLSTSSECLFSLVNGDDMFVTFSALETDSYAIWYLHRAYLYIFISLFIYVVLSVFISVIMDNYESLKYFYEEGFPDTEVQKFIKEDGQTNFQELFSHVKREKNCTSVFFCLFPCLSIFRRKQYYAVGERQHLISSI